MSDISTRLNKIEEQMRVTGCPACAHVPFALRQPGKPEPETRCKRCGRRFLIVQVVYTDRTKVNRCEI